MNRAFFHLRYFSVRRFKSCFVTANARTCSVAQWESMFTNLFCANVGQISYDQAMVYSNAYYRNQPLRNARTQADTHQDRRSRWRNSPITPLQSCTLKHRVRCSSCPEKSATGSTTTHLTCASYTLHADRHKAPPRPAPSIYKDIWSNTNLLRPSCSPAKQYAKRPNLYSLNSLPQRLISRSQSDSAELQNAH